MSISKPKRRTPAVPAKNPKLDNDEKEDTPQTEKTMDDLPPEMLTVILEHVILSQERNEMLVYRLVSSQWKDIVNSILEKEVISRRLEAFPEMKIGGQPDQLSVNCPRTVFRAGTNPLSFNCLLLNGNEYFHQGPADSQMALPIFMSRFGANLTTFALHDQIIGTNALATMLRSMSNLKVLCFKKVELSKTSIGPGEILQPPPLPSLKTLDLRLNMHDEKEDQRRNICVTLYLWLIASYADQLVYLKLVTSDPLPALQKGHKYSIPGQNGETFSIATTSDSAFGKLKELHVYCPSPEFLQFTQTPALQRLSITSWNGVDLRDIEKIILICGGSLQEVSLVVLWNTFDKIAEVVAENVKKLTLFFSEDEETTFDKAVLSMFPALEEIQLLCYNTHNLDDGLASYYSQSQDGIFVGSVANGKNSADEINSLKQRLRPLGEQNAALVRQFGGEARINEAILMVQYKRAPILRQLAALGEDMNEVIVEQMLERHGVWNTCPNLKSVSVSWDKEPVGDVCWIGRPNEA